MTTAPPVLPDLPDVVALPELPKRGTGERSRRRQVRRRLAREQLIVVLFLVLALIATLVILGRQWLDSGGQVTTNPNAITTLTTLTTLSTLSGGST
jgi:hypothetical protein